MKDIFRVARWEIKKNLHSKLFVFMTFGFPLLVLLIGGGVGYIGSIPAGEEELIGVIDETDEVYEELKRYEDGSSYTLESTARNDRDYAGLIEEEGYKGILYIPEEVAESGEVYFYTENNFSEEPLQEQISDIVAGKRLKEAGYSQNEIFALMEEVRVVNRPLEEKGESERLIDSMLPVFLALLLVLASVFSGSYLLQNIMKEKADRIVELLFSSLSAGSQMYGKILGYGVLGLAQICVWGGAGLLGIVLFFDYSVAVFLEIKYLYMFLYFLFGFIMIAALNATIGAVSSGEKVDNSSASNLVAIIPIIPLWFSGVLFSQPDGLLARIMSCIPFLTPVTMVLRLGISPPTTSEILLLLGVVIVFDILLLWLAKKVFRAGMLMYGKSVTPGNIFRALRD